MSRRKSNGEIQNDRNHNQGGKPKFIHRYVNNKTWPNKSDADILAASLIDADLKGIRSHGLMRLPIYVRRMEFGVIDIAKKVEVVKEKGSIKILNANHGLGQGQV